MEEAREEEVEEVGFFLPHFMIEHRIIWFKVRRNERGRERDMGKGGGHKRRELNSSVGVGRK